MSAINSNMTGLEIPKRNQRGCLNLDPNGWILAADETVISTVDLYANGYVEKEGSGSTFGTSFATPTAAAAFTNYLNDWIDELLTLEKI